MKIERVLYHAQATATGGREGSASSSDGILKVPLSTPRELANKLVEKAHVVCSYSNATSNSIDVCLSLV